MAGSVLDGGDGMLFRIGDAGDLRRVLDAVIDRPAILAEMSGQAPAVRTIESQATKIRRHYDAAIADARR